MEKFAYSLTDYSFLALSIGERLLFLSFAGWLLLWLVARAFHRNGNAVKKDRLVKRGKRVAMAPLWMVYLLWLVPAASPFFPAMPQTLLQQLTTSELKAVLAHECAHIARRDDIAVCWQQLVSVVFFFNPLLGYANRQLAQMREICCDHLAIRRCGFDPRVYAQTLLRVIEQLGGGVKEQQEIPVPALLAQDVQLRLQALVSPNADTYRWWPPLTLLVSLLCVSFFLGGTGKPASPAIQGDAVKTLVTIPHVMPLENGRITGGVHFHEPLGCYLPTRDAFHAGIDFAPGIASATATSVRAFAAGVIESITKPPHDIGFMVRISHPQGLQSTYVRLDQVNVPVGTHLKVGQVFASMGAKPQTNHLHFELTHRGQILDPAVLLAK